MSDIIETLHREGCSCVIARGDAVTLCRARGVADLLRLLTTSPGTLAGAIIADKVVGKGAAALMILGGVSAVYGRLTDNIINRAATGICPVESLCAPCRTAGECLPLIMKFVSENSKNTSHE